MRHGPTTVRIIDVATNSTRKLVPRHRCKHKRDICEMRRALSLRIKLLSFSKLLLSKREPNAKETQTVAIVPPRNPDLELVVYRDVVQRTSSGSLTEKKNISESVFSGISRNLPVAVRPHKQTLSQLTLPQAVAYRRIKRTEMCGLSCVTYHTQRN